jgi:hypothetical protein
VADQRRSAPSLRWALVCVERTARRSSFACRPHLSLSETHNTRSSEDRTRSTAHRAFPGKLFDFGFLPLWIVLGHCSPTSFCRSCVRSQPKPQSAEKYTQAIERSSLCNDARVSAGFAKATNDNLSHAVRAAVDLSHGACLDCCRDRRRWASARPFLTKAVKKFLT